MSPPTRVSTRRSTVYVGMVGDLLHAGHVNVLERARALGDVTVGVLSDEAVASYKRVPFMKLADRIKVVENLSGIARVIVQTTLSYRSNLESLRPDFVVHGDDWRWGEQALARQEVIDVLAQWKGELVEVPYTQGVSSTLLTAHFADQGITPRSRAAQLRHVLSIKPFVRIVDAHCAWMARAVSEAKVGKKGFDALWYGCDADAKARGEQQPAHVDLTRRLSALGEMMDATNLPIIYAGMAEPDDRVAASARALDRLGIAALCATSDPGGEPGHCLVAMRGATTSNNAMLLTILTSGDSRATLDMARRSIESGAEALVLRVDAHALARSCEAVRALRAAGFGIPVLLASGGSDAIDEEAIAQSGAKGVIYESALFDAMSRQVDDIAGALLGAPPRHS